MDMTAFQETIFRKKVLTTQRDLRPVRTFRSNRIACKVCYLVAIVLVVLFPGEAVHGAPLRGHGGGGRLSRACPEEDVTVKAYRAGTVFEGKARSISSSPKNGIYNVTFVVKKVYKGGEPNLPRSQVRLQFAEKVVANINSNNNRNNNEPCDSINHNSRDSVVKASIKQGGRYIVFVDRIGPHLFRPRGEPVKANKKNMLAVEAVVCQNCVRAPSMVDSLKDTSVPIRSRLRLTCRSKGNPVPALTWYRDGRRLGNGRRIRIIANRRRGSTLVIKKVKADDEGRYECRAVSVTGDSAAISARVTVTSDTRQDNRRPDNATTLWPMVPQKCPIDTFCLNEGTCVFFETVGELVCKCAEGFKGKRCENKDVRGSMYRPYSCKLGISSLYYC